MQEDIKKAFEVLRDGGVILYPTDTIWGLGCDATNPAAVEKIFKIKQRADNKSLIVLMGNINSVERYVYDAPAVALDIMELAFKPTTIIFEGAHNLAHNVINPTDNSVGIRIPNDAFCQALLQKFRKPIVSTSANISGEAAPGNFGEISLEILEAVDYVVEHRQHETNKGQASSIIKIGTDQSVQIIRP